MKKVLLFLIMGTFFTGFSFADITPEDCYNNDISNLNYIKGEYQKQLNKLIYISSTSSSTSSSLEQEKGRLQSQINSLSEQIQTVNQELNQCLLRNETEYNNILESNSMFDKGTLSYKQGDYEVALGFFKDYVERYPFGSDWKAAQTNVSICYYQLAMESFENGIYSGAILLFTKAEVNYTEKYNLYFNMGITYYKMGNKTKALEFFYKAYIYATTDANKKESQGAIDELTDLKTTPKNITIKEIDLAVQWMYTKGLTMYDNTFDFRPKDLLTRQEASKFFVNFTKVILGKKVDKSKSVSFNDIVNADITLQNYINESFQLGLFQGANNKFSPFNKLTVAQSLAVIIRSKDGYLPETNTNRYSDYYKKSSDYGLLAGLGFNYNSLYSSNITREQVAILLYRMSLYLNQ